MVGGISDHITKRRVLESVNMILLFANEWDAYRRRITVSIYLKW